MVWNYRNGLAGRGTSQGFWLSLNEDEFIGELRKAGWSENALQQELVTLRAYKDQFRIVKPLPPTVDGLVEQLEAKAEAAERIPALAEPSKPKSRYFGLMRTRKQKQQHKAAEEESEQLHDDIGNPNPG